MHVYARVGIVSRDESSLHGRGSFKIKNKIVSS